ncbi:MAG: hypothetical protein AMXMBFR83_10910 [Phycisphaerae bacterium]
MDARDQVMFVLQVVMALGPIALYFLGLGLVNSQSRPFLISARRDFTLLASAFIPLILVPAIGLVRQGHAWLAGLSVLLVAGLFVVMLPGRRATWVIYNVSAGQLRRVFERVCRRNGWRSRCADGEWLIEPAGLKLMIHRVSWLRNATIEIHPVSPEGPDRMEPFLGGLAQELERESMLPSPTGASLVVIGAALLGLPMWYLFHHMDLIVHVVRRFLFA